jgi:hypothetical protein
MNYTQLKQIYEGEDFQIRTGAHVKQLFECRTYNKHGKLEKVEAPTLSELAKKDLAHLKDDKLFIKWVNSI